MEVGEETKMEADYINKFIRNEIIRLYREDPMKALESICQNLENGNVDNRVDKEDINHVKDLVRLSGHKRMPPPAPRPSIYIPPRAPWYSRNPSTPSLEVRHHD